MANYDTDEYRPTKQKLKIIGIILLLVGATIMIFGGVTFFTAFSSFANITGENIGESAGTYMTEFAIGGFSLVIGFAIVGFGIQLVMTAHARAIAKYAATEAAPATAIMTEAIATGFSKGMQGSKMTQSPSGREVIKVKCRNCGYLESEDATFCSKCGGKV